MPDGIDKPELLDVRDMLAVHEALDRGLQTAATAIRAADDGDLERARCLGEFLADVLHLLQLHHEGEDELLYPLVRQRDEASALLLARMSQQHESVVSSVASCRDMTACYSASAASADAGALSAEIAVLRSSLTEHVSEEEGEFLSIAARVVTPPEWGALPEHALSHYPGERLWLPLGLVIEALPDDLREEMFEHLPPPVAGMWNGGGSAAFEQEMSTIRG